MFRGDDFFKSRGGQLTIFIIVGVLMVSAIALFFAFRAGIIPGIGGAAERNPDIFLSACMEDKVREAITLLSFQGGYIEENPLSLRFLFKEDKEYYNISYLCYTSLYYVPCFNQNPSLINSVENEIKNYISDDVQTCFDEMERNFDRQGYDVNQEYNGFEVVLNSGKISIKTDSSLNLTKSEETTTQEDFEILETSKLNDLLEVAQEIVSQQAEFCNFNANGFMLTYPKFKIETFNLGSDGLIYTLTHKESEEKFRFAVRSCFIPSGIINE